MNGTWLGEHIVFTNSGTASQPITLKAYTDASILDGIDRYDTSNIGVHIQNRSFINIEGITITNYYFGLYIRDANNVNLDNIGVNNTYNIGVYFIDVTYSSLKNSDINNNGWNSVMIQSNYSPTNNIIIQNNKIHDNPGTSGHTTGHNLIDLFNYGLTHQVSDIDIIENEIYNGAAASNAIFAHGGTILEMNNITINNNIIHNTSSARVSYLKNSTISNNVVYNNFVYGIISVSIPIYDNVHFSGNTIYGIPDNFDYWISVDPTANNVTFSNDDVTLFRIDVGTAIIKDPIKTAFNIRSAYGGKIYLRFNNNKLFSVNGINDVTYNPSYSEYSTSGDESVSIMTYPMTAKPALGVVAITVDKFNTELGVNEILVELTINTTNGNNINFVLKELLPGSNYLIKKDDVELISLQSDSLGEITFNNSDWTPSTKITVIKQEITSTFPISISSTPHGAIIKVDGTIV